MKVLYFGFIALIVFFCGSCVQVVVPEQKTTLEIKPMNQKEYDSLLNLSYSLLERTGLFSNMLIHETQIVTGTDTNKKIQPCFLGFRYAYPAVHYVGKIDSLKKTIDFQNPLLQDFVLADSLRFFSQVEYCLSEDTSDKCKNYITRIDVNKIPKHVSEYEKAIIFVGALNMPYKIDTTARNLKYTLSTFYPSTMPVYNFTKQLIENSAMVLYVYFFRYSQKFDRCIFETQNVNEYGYTETHVFAYNKNDKLFTTIKQSIEFERIAVH